MNSETFLKRLDVVRAEARSTRQPLVFNSESVQKLLNLVDEIHEEGLKKVAKPIEQTKAEPPPPSIDQLAELEPIGEDSLPKAMTMTRLPRDPVPVHPVVVVEATKDTVVAPDGGWQDGDS